MASEDLCCRHGKEIIGLTNPAAKSGNVPPGPINRTYGYAGSVRKTAGTNPPGAPGKPVKPEETRVPYLPNQSLVGAGEATKMFSKRRLQCRRRGSLSYLDSNAEIRRGRINPRQGSTTLRRGIN